MAKKVVKKIKVEVPAGEAVPSQKLGPALGQAGVNIGEFISRFNEATRDQKGDIIPVEILVFEDRSFDLVYKTPPAARLILKAAGIEKGSGKNIVKKAGSVTNAQVRAIAERKMPDLNAASLGAAEKIIAGTARSMGIDIRG